jgi:hypothetical protein
MSSSDRQNRLLLSEDWKRVYQSFRNADFKSYDFDNLRRTMVQYLRENYPEDFNDYTESSEYLALIDLIAYLGQNIAFRIDLNARENYLELAERRESVLRLARLLSYNPKRNQAANGLLKLQSVRTSEEVYDSNNINLQGQTIVWNDPSNSEWYEQFIKILNLSLPVNNTFGRSNKNEIINGITTEQYRFNSVNNDVPIFSFNKVIDGRSLQFEITSTDISADAVLEEAPFPGNKFAFIFKDDGKGITSPNTGFFSHFRQGTLDQGVFTVNSPSTNQAISVEALDINDSDVWLYGLDSLGNESELWTKVEALQGNNIIYNSLSKKERNIYSVLTRVDDRISLMFSDGIFGNLPKGSFRVYYRTSQNDRTIVTPRDLSNVSISISYISRSGKTETLRLIYNLQYTVDNSAESESTDSIRFNAPSTYYTQNRMVTGEDYQLAPLGISQNIVKSKSVNRTSSGISRYFDLIDATGKYSKTTLYGNDGVLYKEYSDLLVNFAFQTKTDVEGVILNSILPVLSNKKVRNYYFDKFPRILTGDLEITWNQETTETNLSTGYFKNKEGAALKLGSFTSSILSLLKQGTLIKFIAPTGSHFNKDLDIVSGNPSIIGDTTYKWVKLISVNGTGFEIRDDNTGAVYLNDEIPTGAILSEIKPALPNNLIASVKQQVIDQIFAYKTFGLRFDQTASEWRIVTENNLSIGSEFSTGKSGDTTNQQLDASWILLFETDGERYSVTYRGMRYVFESDKEIKFYYDPTEKIYDSNSGKIIKDLISVLSVNYQPDSTSAFTKDYNWEIVDIYRDVEGYVDSKKIEISFFDADEDGIVDDADLFEEIASPSVNTLNKYVIFKRIKSTDGVEDFNYLDNANKEVIILSSKSEVRPFSEYSNGQVFYYIDNDIFEVLDQSILKLNISADYKARLGRTDLKFRYVHSASANERIDPSASNIIDMYLLERNYDTSYRNWLLNKSTTKPLPPSSDQMHISYAPSLNQIKSLTDEIIYHPVKYKVLFGSNAEEDLQATFKVVKNKDKVLNNNDIKTRVITAINQFFALENWDFGETFYFSELANYVMYKLSPDLSTFIIVPNQGDQGFGSLFEIKSESNEIFISGASVDNIEIIDAVTASKLKADSNIVTEVSSANVGIQSSALDETATKVSPTQNVITNINRGNTY